MNNRQTGYRYAGGIFWLAMCSILFLVSACTPVAGSLDADQQTIQILQDAYQKFAAMTPQEKQQFRDLYTGEPFAGLALAHKKALAPENFWVPQAHRNDQPWMASLSGYYRLPDGAILRAIVFKPHTDATSPTVSFLISFLDSSACLTIGKSDLLSKVLYAQTISVSGRIGTMSQVRDFSRNPATRIVNNQALERVCSHAGELTPYNTGTVPVVDMWWEMRVPLAAQTQPSAPYYHPPAQQYQFRTQH